MRDRCVDADFGLPVLRQSIGELSLDDDGRPILNEKRQFRVVEEMYPVSRGLGTDCTLLRRLR